MTIHSQGRRTKVKNPGKRKLRLLLAPLSLALCANGCSWDQLNPFAAAPPAAAAGQQESVILRASHLEAAPSIAGAEGSRDLAAARELFRQKDYAKAEKIFHRLAEEGADRKSAWDEVFRFSGKKPEVNAVVAEEARFYEGECLHAQKNYPKAADTYVRLLGDFGSSAYREQAVQRLFDIGNYWLEDTREGMRLAKEVREGKRWFAPPNPFHVDKTKPFLDEEGRALEALEAVRYNDINGPLADKALFLLGSVHFFNENYREADYHFTQLVESHPNSSFAAQATELGIISKHMCTGGSDYDGRKVAEARELVHKAQVSYPQLSGDPDKREFLERQLVGITLQQAEKDYKTAEFYRHTGKPCSAYWTYEVVRRRYPGTKYADLATERMLALKARAEKENGGPLPVPVRGAVNPTPPPQAAPGAAAPPRQLPDLGQR